MNRSLVSGVDVYLTYKFEKKKKKYMYKFSLFFFGFYEVNFLKILKINNYKNLSIHLLLFIVLFFFSIYLFIYSSVCGAILSEKF